MGEVQDRGARRFRRFLGLFWVTWFGFIISFAFIAVVEVRREFFANSVALPFSSSLTALTLLSWIAFFVADAKLPERGPVAVNLLTMLGAVLAGMTLLGIFYFVSIAPRVQ